MRENIWQCAIYSKLNRLQELAPAAVTVTDSTVTVSAQMTVELLFGDAYAAFVERAVQLERSVFLAEPYDTVDPPTLIVMAQSFSYRAYKSVIERGENPKKSPDFYGISAPTASQGWPVYFFAVGTGLNLPAEAHRGKVELPNG